LFATVAAQKSTKLDASVGASGPHDFAVRAGVFVKSAARVHRIPPPTFVTIAKRPSVGTGWFAVFLFAPAVKLNSEIPKSRGDYSLVDARVNSFQSAPCFCQFIRMWRLVELFLPSATDSLSPTQ
jgi:hypothetical protein